MMVPCPVSMVPGIGDCLGNFGGGGLGSGAESDFARPRSGASAETVDPGETQQELPFSGGLPAKLAPFTGGKTSGIFQFPDGNTLTLQSGYDGPAKSMPPESAGFNGYTKLHVEGHASALMRQQGIAKGTLYINNPKICDSCTKLLSKMLPPRSTLRIVLPDGTVKEFRGLYR